MIQKIDHIGIAVKSHEQALALYRDTLGFRETHREEIASEGVRVICLEAGGDHIELLEPVDDNSPVAKFLATRGEGIHHIAIAVDDIVAHLASLKKDGVRLIHNEPRLGVGGSKIAFVHPKAANGVLVELTEKGSGDE